MHAQTKTVDISVCSTINLLMKEMGKFLEKASNVAKEEGTNITMPRLAKCETKGANGPAESTKDYWMRKLFFPFMDHLSSELRSTYVILNCG